MFSAMDALTLLLLLRFAVALAAMVFAYFFYRWIQNRHATPERQDRVLLGAYVATRLGFWLLFATYLQRIVACVRYAALPVIARPFSGRAHADSRLLLPVRSAIGAGHAALLCGPWALPGRHLAFCDLCGSSSVVLFFEVDCLASGARRNGSNLGTGSTRTVPTESRDPVLDRYFGLSQHCSNALCDGCFVLLTARLFQNWICTGTIGAAGSKVYRCPRLASSPGCPSSEFIQASAQCDTADACLRSLSDGNRRYTLSHSLSYWLQG